MTFIILREQDLLEKRAQEEISGMNFFSIENGLKVLLMAAESTQAVLGHLGSSTDPMSIVRHFGYDLSTFKSIPYQLAICAPSFDEFYRARRFAFDGTFYLGTFPSFLWKRIVKEYESSRRLLAKSSLQA